MTILDDSAADVQAPRRPGPIHRLAAAVKAANRSLMRRLASWTQDGMVLAGHLLIVIGLARITDWGIAAIYGGLALVATVSYGTRLPQRRR